MASRAKYDHDEGDDRGLIYAILAQAKVRAPIVRRNPHLTAHQSIIFRPVAPFVSRTALRAYLTTILLFITSLFLLALATTAYTLFYWSYIPRIGFERTVHLQFDDVYSNENANSHPYGTANLAPDLVSAQGYDVWIELNMPRTAENQDAGNFMINVELLAPNGRNTPSADDGNMLPTISADRRDPTASNSSTLLARSRRPAILPYRSRPIELLFKCTQLPWYLLGLRSETSDLRIPVFERILFARGRRNIPSTLRLEIQSTHRLQIYTATASFRARFRGLRWVMYNHRIISAVVFVSTFWTTELLFAGLAWAALSFYLSSERGAVKEEAKQIKDEPEDDRPPALSDTERTFPTLRGQTPLRYTSPPETEIKREPEDEEAIVPISEAVANAAEADDEDEDVDFFDSGIGTSLESSGPARRESMRRRLGRGRQGGEKSFRDGTGEER